MRFGPRSPLSKTILAEGQLNLRASPVKRTLKNTQLKNVLAQKYCGSSAPTLARDHFAPRALQRKSKSPMQFSRRRFQLEDTSAQQKVTLVQKQLAQERCGQKEFGHKGIAPQELWPKGTTCKGMTASRHRGHYVSKAIRLNPAKNTGTRALWRKATLAQRRFGPSAAT